MSEIFNIPVHELRNKLDNKEISSRELTQVYLDRIGKIDDKVKSYLLIREEDALKDAENADKIIAKGDVASLTGIPLSLKDIFLTKGVTTTVSSKFLENFVPPYDSTVVSKLKKSGYVLLGKLNMDEFAMGSSTENSAFFPTKNPWDIERIPGGSSGGSAAAVAARLTPGTFGTDTGGSIRQPSSLCGVTGLKPTYGRVSRYGVVAFASSLDQVGPITLDVEDAALFLEVVAGKDPNDSTRDRKSVV